MDRTSLVASLAAEAHFALLTRAGSLCGFAALRPFGRGEVIGPVIAPSREEAASLVAFMLAARPGAFLRIDLPEEAGLAPWVTERGLVPVGDGVAMRLGGDDEAPAIPRRVHTFALASQALG